MKKVNWFVYVGGCWDGVILVVCDSLKIMHNQDDHHHQAGLKHVLCLNQYINRSLFQELETNVSIDWVKILPS